MENEFCLAGDIPAEAAVAEAQFKLNGLSRKPLLVSYADGIAKRTVAVFVACSRRIDTHGRVQIEIEGETVDRRPFRASLNYANPSESGIVFDPKP